MVDSKVHLAYRYRHFDDTSEEVALTPDYVMMYEWFSAWYNAAIGFALVETNPRTQNQIILMTCVYIINAMINAYLIGVFID